MEFFIHKHNLLQDLRFFLYITLQLPGGACLGSLRFPTLKDMGPRIRFVQKVKISLFREIHGKMSSTVDRRPFAVRLTGFEVTLIMPIRIRCRDKGQQRCKAMTSQESWASGDATQWRLIRTGNEIFASYADQSNYCYVPIGHLSCEIESCLF